MNFYFREGTKKARAPLRRAFELSRSGSEPEIGLDGQKVDAVLVIAPQGPRHGGRRDLHRLANLRIADEQVRIAQIEAGPLVQLVAQAGRHPGPVLIGQARGPVLVADRRLVVSEPAAQEQLRSE